jgi:hypothetical protein
MSTASGKFRHGQRVRAQMADGTTVEGTVSRIDFVKPYSWAPDQTPIEMYSITTSADGATVLPGRFASELTEVES